MQHDGVPVAGRFDAGTPFSGYRTWSLSAAYWKRTLARGLALVTVIGMP
ncbi:MAG: hypothetical protein U0R28_05590 [Candidatus Nanopelagicales bacterium]